LLLIFHHIRGVLLHRRYAAVKDLLAADSHGLGPR